MSSWFGLSIIPGHAVSDDDDGDDDDWMMVMRFIMMMMMKIDVFDSDAAKIVAIHLLFAFLIILVIF